MDIIPGGASALPWYDRGITIATKSSKAVFTTVGESDHWIYEVAVNKQARIVGLHIFFSTEIVQSSPSSKTHKVYYTPNGGGEILINTSVTDLSVLGHMWNIVILQYLILSAGDKIRVTYKAIGTGGSHVAAAHLIAHEYTP